ncbi:MAG: hypothetical protein K8H74_18890 [Notoacmeibacter sp.]|nr:hypothetical protein [Notoacmeibacter sp.]
MTKVVHSHLPGWRRGGFLAAMLAGMMAFGGCRTASLEDVAPTSLLPPTSAVATLETVPGESQTATATQVDKVQEGDGARNTGRYPNLNIVPTGETAQISEEERVAKVAELNAAKQEAQSPAGKKGDQAEKLRRIARKHAQEALEQIEAE